jgi:curved DNA-binding protein CbpA
MNANLTMKTRNASLYETLEVSPSASFAVIKAAYHCLAQRCHPDKNPNDPDAAMRMCMINHAYATLSDELLRAQYDDKMGFRVVERRGRGRTSIPVRSGAGRGGASLRLFVFRAV